MEEATATGRHAGRPPAGAGAAPPGPGLDLSEQEERLVRVFRALGQRSRFALWKSLAHQCVCLGERGGYCTKIQRSLDLAQSTVSHHLKVLQLAGLVHCTKEGAWCCYRVDPRTYAAIIRLLSELGGFGP